MIMTPQTKFESLRSKTKAILRKLYFSTKNEELKFKYESVIESLKRINSSEESSEELKLQIEEVSELIEVLVHEGERDLMKEILFNLVHMLITVFH